MGNEFDNIPDWAREELVQGRCAIGRFWGQTYIYVPLPFCERLNEEVVYELATEIFTKERMKRFGGVHLFRRKGFCAFEVPSSFSLNYRDQRQNPGYHKPDQLVEKIMAL